MASFLLHHHKPAERCPTTPVPPGLVSPIVTVFCGSRVFVLLLCNYKFLLQHQILFPRIAFNTNSGDLQVFPTDYTPGRDCGSPQPAHNITKAQTRNLCSYICKRLEC